MSIRSVGRDHRRAKGLASAAGTGAWVETVQGAAALEGLRHEWEALFAGCEGPRLCASHAWVLAWWTAFGNEGASPFVVLVRDEASRLVAAFPLFEERPRWGLRRLRGLGFLGREETDDMTEEPTHLILPGWEVRAMGALVEVVGGHLRKGRWDYAIFRHLEASPVGTLVEAFAPLRSRALVWSDRATGPYLAELPATWAEYRKALSKSMRDNLGYYPRLLTRDGHDWAVRIVRDPLEIDAAVLRLADLHRARALQARGAEHFNHLQGAVQLAFLRGLMARLAAEGRGCVGELVVGGEVVASQAFVEDGETLMVYYSGYREAWYRYSPVFVIGATAIREALERGVRRVDFLRVARDWKARWGATECVPMDRVFVASLRPASLLRLGAHLLAVTIRMDVVDRVPVLMERAKRRLSKERE